MNITPELLKRFHRRVHRRTGRRGSCWIWTGERQRKPSLPYGIFRHTGRRAIVAHKFSFLAYGGSLAPGEDVAHRCHTPLCVNPAHLRPLSHLANVHESYRHGRLRKPDYARRLLSLRVVQNYLAAA